MDTFQWLHTTLGGEFCFTALVSMLPVVELRGGIPFGLRVGLPLPLAVAAAVLGNMAPVPFLILFTRRVFAWLRRRLPALEGLIARLERRAAEKRELVQRYKFWGLLVLVAIPLPGTGAWTGALAAAFLDMPLRRALPSIFLGVVTAGLIMTLATGMVVATIH